MSPPPPPRATSRFHITLGSCPLIQAGFRDPWGLRVMTPDRSALLPNRRFLGPGMRKAFAGFLVTALATASTTPLCSGSAFAQQLPAQAAAVQSAPEAAASQSAQEPAGQAAANCPGHPDALGTSRVLALDPTEYPRVGRMQYPELTAAQRQGSGADLR